MYARTVTLLARGVTAQHSALASHLPFAAPAVAVSHRFLHATPVCERKRTGKYEKRIKTAAAKAKASALLDTQDAAQATRRNLLNTLAAEGEGVADGTTDTPAGGPKLVYGFTDEMVATCDPEVQKVFALENADKEEINRLRVMNAMRAMQRFEGDTGSPEVQIAGLTARIRILVEHLSEHHKDNHSRFGLNKLVQRRRNLLMYLRSTDLPKYATTLTALGLRPIKTIRNSHSQ